MSLQRRRLGFIAAASRDLQWVRGPAGAANSDVRRGSQGLEAEHGEGGGLVGHGADGWVGGRVEGREVRLQVLPEADECPLVAHLQNELGRHGEASLLISPQVCFM